MSSECTLVLQLLSDGLINVDEAERLITRIRPLRDHGFGNHITGISWPRFVPPHFLSGFGAQSTTLAL